MTPLAPGSTRSAVTLLALAAFCSGAALRVTDSLLPRLASDFQRSAGAAGLVAVSFAVAYGLMQLVFGPLGDRYGKQRVIMLALGGCAAASALSALSPSFEALVGLRLVWGMAAAGVIPLAMAWIGDTVPYADRQATIAKLSLGTLSGMVAGQLLGGLFAEAAAGWRGAFLTLALGHAVVGALLFSRMRRSGDEAHASGASARSGQIRLVLGTPWTRVVLLAVGIEGMFLLASLAYLPTFLHRKLSITVVAASGVAALFALGGLAYALCARRIVSVLGEQKMMVWGGSIAGAGCAVLWLAGNWPAAATAALATGFGTSLLHATLQTQATQMAPAARGTSVALFAFVLFSAQAAGVFIYGLAVDHVGFAPVFLAPAVALPLAGWWFATALRRRDRRLAEP